MISRKVVGVVGMPGSGKSFVDDVAVEMGFSIVIMGDVIREEVSKMGLEPNPKNVGRVMVEIRRREGPAVVAKKCIPIVQSLLNRDVMVEGIRNLAEVYEFRRRFPGFKLIAIYASPETRFRRIVNRSRSDDAVNWQTFTKRDLREIKVGIGSAIALADYALINEGTVRCFKANVKKCLKAILSE